MKVTVEQESPIKKKVEIQVDADRVSEHIDAAYDEIKKTAKLKGFRPGKVPRNVLEKHYQQDAESQAMRSLVDQTYPEALTQEGIFPLSYPQIEITRFDPIKELVYVARFEVKPELGAIQKYKGLKLKPEAAKVTDKELKDQLTQLQNHRAKLESIDPPRALKKGDVITFDYEALKEGQSFEGNKVDGYMAEFGSGTLLKEFEDNLKDAKIGDKREIDVTLPDDFADKNFAGKKMHYSVHLKDVKQKVLPKLDDEFAKDLGQEDLKALKKQIKEDLAGQKKRADRGRLHREVVESLVKANEFEVPESMIESELASMFDQLTQNLKMQGQSAEALGITPEVFREKNLAEATLRVKGMLLFERIWIDESIQVNDEDREAKLEEVARMTNQQKVNVRQFYEANQDRMRQLDALILQDKTLDFILAEAKIDTKQAKKSE